MENRLRGCSLDPMHPIHRAYFAITMLLLSLATPARAQQKPNILVIFGDDIGQANISRYTHGVVGYMSPNIDRIGAEGMTFTDYYAENSCTAGRSSFITGQSPMRERDSPKLERPERPSACKRAISRSRKLSNRKDTPPASSAKITWATATSTFPPITVSTNSLATSIT